MKKLLTVLFLILSFEAKSQIFTQTYVDKCTGEAKTAVSTPMNNGMTMIAFYNQIRTFTNAEITNGTARSWLNQVYADYNSRPCPVSNVIQQTIQATVSQATATSAASAASSAATAASSANTTPSNETGGSSEQKQESKEKSESKSEENSEENSEEKEKEDKKKRSGANPMLVTSDLATQHTDGRYAAMISMGISRSSMTGAESWGLTSLIWTTLDQFALNGGYTKMKLERGSLKSINSYSMTAAYLKGNLMLMHGYTYIKPDPKLGTYGYNVGIISLFSKDDKKYNLSISTSVLAFWTKPYQMSRKVTLSPQIFLSNSPITWNTEVRGQSVISKNMSYMLGFSYDYKLSKRFGFNANYRFASSTYPDSEITHNFMIGSRMTL